MSYDQKDEPNFHQTDICMRYRQLAEEKENVSNCSSEYSLRFNTAWVATCQTKLKIV